MKTIKFVFAIVSFSLLLVSCNKNDDENPEAELDYLIFGTMYGFCQGESCIEIFKLEDGKLYEDLNDNYPGQEDYYEADFVELSNSVFEQADGLENLFPVSLLDETAVVIGQPDAGDWGGLYIEYKVGDVRDFWLMDQMKPNVPEAYHDFIDAINAKIQLINE